MTMTDRVTQAYRRDVRNRFLIADPFRRWAPFMDYFTKRPLLAADIDPGTVNQASQRLTLAMNPDWMVAGTNMTSALSTFSSGGGITLTTAGANADQAILQPAFTNTNVYLTGIGGTTGAAGTAPWLSAKEIEFNARISLSSVAAVRFMMGFKLTNTPTLATDNDQAMFHFDTAATLNTTFRCVSSNTNVDQEVVTGGEVGPLVVAAATDYMLRIVIDENRNPHFYINGALAYTGAQLATPMAFLPFIGIQALAVAAKAVSIREVGLSRIF